MKKQQGFNLIEVLMVVALIAILVVVGTPSLQYMIINNRITAKTNELVSALNAVRSEVVTRGDGKYKMRPGTPDNVNGTDWSEGWIIWYDGDPSGVDNMIDDDRTEVDEDTGDTTEIEGEYILKHFYGINGITIQKISSDPLASSVVQYSGRGKLVGNPFQFSICLQDRKENEPKGRLIEVGLSGSVILVNREFDCMPEAESE